MKAKSSSLVDEVYTLPPLQKTPPSGSRSFSRHQMPNGYIVTYCDNLTQVPSVKREFKPNPEVTKRLKSLSDFSHSISASLGTKSYFENSQKPAKRRPRPKNTSKARAQTGFQYWYKDTKQLPDKRVRSHGAFGSKNTVLGLSGGSSHIKSQPVNALHFSRPTANLESMIKATAPLQWIGATFQNM